MLVPALYTSAFYLRIMVDKKLRVIVWTCIGMVTGFGLGNVVAMGVSMYTNAFFWDGWRVKCKATAVLTYDFSASSVVQ